MVSSAPALPRLGGGGRQHGGGPPGRTAGARGGQQGAPAGCTGGESQLRHSGWLDVWLAGRKGAQVPAVVAQALSQFLGDWVCLEKFEGGESRWGAPLIASADLLLDMLSPRHPRCHTLGSPSGDLGMPKLSWRPSINDFPIC